MTELIKAFVEAAIVRYEHKVEDLWNESADDCGQEVAEAMWRDEFRLCQRALRQLRPNLFEEA